MMMLDRVAIVTGAARGIGWAFAVKLSAVGAKVVAADILDATGTVEEIEANGGTATALEVDVTSAHDTQEMAEETIKRFGRIDILINNAAKVVATKRFYEIEPDEWDEVMAVNVKGQWLCTRAVFPQMKKQNRGSIVNISSTSFLYGAGPLAHYVASKAAVVGLTRALARELGEYGINVNAVAPGFTQTEGSKVLEHGGFISRAASRCIKHDLRPEDITGTIAFLCSDEGRFITGQTIVVDAGGSFL
jgi:NAD(P)-dependent dehydrogenase (short-subunit alcohol dehydrogenase family)